MGEGSIVSAAWGKGGPAGPGPRGGGGGVAGPAGRERARGVPRGGPSPAGPGGPRRCGGHGGSGVSRRLPFFLPFFLSFSIFFFLPPPPRNRRVLHCSSGGGRAVPGAINKRERGAGDSPARSRLGLSGVNTAVPAAGRAQTRRCPAPRGARGSLRAHSFGAQFLPPPLGPAPVSFPPASPVCLPGGREALGAV